MIRKEKWVFDSNPSVMGAIAGITCNSALQGCRRPLRASGPEGATGYFTLTNLIFSLPKQKSFMIQFSWFIRYLYCKISH